MADTKKKSTYNFGGHEFDAELYLQNLKDNAQGYLDSRSDWNDAQKEEWKHSYENFTNALAQDIKDGTGRFSTDEFGNITDSKGEFTNTDSDNYYYNDKGEQISGDDYNNLKDRKKKKYSGFESNRWLATYANQIGTALRDKLKEKGTDSTSDSEDFDYAKNGFAAFWNKKHNPAGGEVDVQPYWDLDKDGGYTNRINSTLTDLEEYLQRDDLPDNVRKNAEAYRDKLQEYLNKGEGFNEDTWKSQLRIAAQNAGMSTWNNGFFKLGTSDSTVADSSKKEFDINNDQDVIDRYQLADQIAAHPEQRDHIIDLARRQYNQESQKYDEEYNAAVKQEQDAKNNKIWETYLANNPSYSNVSKRNFGTEVFGNGYVNGNSDFEYASSTSQTALKRLQNAFKTGNRKGDFLRTSIGLTVNGGKQKLSNLGEALAYYKPLLDKTPGGWDQFEKVKDNNGNEIYKLKGSENAKGQALYIWFNNGKAHAYRDDSYSTRKAQVVSKAQLGMKLQTTAEKEAAKQKATQKVIDNPQTPHEQKVALTKQERIGANPFNDKATLLRTTALATDLGAMIASFSGVGAPASAAIGAAATAQNQAADMAEGQTFWESLGNNALGYGMDALSVIPFVRGIAGTGRIVKTASKLAPHIITALGAVSALKNKDAYIDSWKKVTSTPDKMTRQDWSNLYDSARLLVAGTTAGTQAIKGNRAMKGAISQDKVKVKTNEGYVTIDKSKLEGIKNTKGLQAQNKALQEATGNANLQFSAVRNKWRKWKTKDQADIKESEVYDFTKPNTRMINGVEYERPYKWGELGIADHKWQYPRWMSGIMDKIETTGLKPTGRTQADIAASSPTSNPTGGTTGTTSPTSTSQLSIAELRELSSKLKPLREEWAKLKGAASNARKSRALDLQAARKETIKDIRDAYLASAEQNRQSMEALATEYAKLRNLVNNNKLTFELGPSKKQVDIDWNALLKKYGIKYKQGGSIRKFQAGGQPDWYSTLQAKGDYDSNKYAHEYDTSTLYAGDMSNGPQDYYVSNQNGSIKQRYAPTNGTFGDSVQAIEDQDYYKRFGKDLLNETGTDFSEMGKAWAKAVDAQLPAGSEASFYDAQGNLRKQWWAKNQDAMGRTTKQAYTTLADYVAKVRNDQILGARHNVFLNRGKRYFYKDNKGVQHWVDPKEVDNYVHSDKPVASSWSGDGTTYWEDYELTGKKSAVNPMGEKPAAPQGNTNQGLQEPDLIAKWGIPRAMAADATNRAVTDKLKKRPLLLDPQEDHRYIQSDLDAEMDGTAAAAQYYRYAANPITSDGDTQTALGLEAVGKANDAITQGRQTSNQRLRTMAEQAWQQEVANHTSRHNTAMTNRQSIYDTKNANNSLEAAYDNQKFTIWDTLAQEKEYKEKSDYEQLRAKYDQFAQQDINNSIKYGMLGLNYKAYGMTDADAKLWDSVYNTGTETLENIQKDPAKMKQWNRILSITRQMQNDMLAQHYHIPQSPYHTVRTASYSPTITTSATKQKQGGCLNVKKVRAAAKGEKLAAAQLKAQTADADRFYKTTKDTIDRMYDAIDRLTSYSSTKKKRKKKS